MRASAVFSVKISPRSACLPFLYHTRTLAPLFRHQARLSSSTTDPTEDSEAASLESTATSRELERKRAYAQEVASYPTVAEWQRIQAQQHGNSARSIPFQDYQNRLPRSDIDQFESVTEPLEEGEDGLNDYGHGSRKQYDPDSYRPGAPPKESTITDSERQAFNRIFSDILGKLKEKGQTTGRETMTFQSQNTDAARMATAELMDEAARDVAAKNNARRASVSFRPLEPTEEAVDIQERMRIEIEKYPPSLRPAASRALASVARRDVLDSSTQYSESPEQLDEVNRLEHLRIPERERVEELMRAAKTDFELWQVLEREVFSIIGRLGLKHGEEQPESSRSAGKTKEKTKNTTKDKASQEVAAPTVDSNKDLGASQLEILGPLYPSHLLLGIRLLTTSFSQPSQLALSVLPHIKSLGVISQVLGASTALYNELLRIQWLRYDDYDAVINLLSEMENSALDFDRETLEIVQGIQRMRERVSGGERGEVVKALFLQRYAPFARIFAKWERKIRAEVAARNEEFERRLTWAR